MMIECQHSEITNWCGPNRGDLPEGTMREPLVSSSKAAQPKGRIRLSAYM
jgi:hypothetical protein